MIGLDLLGAGENLATQTILLKIKSIDPEKLRKSLDAGSWGAALAPALAVVDQFPKLAIDTALPVAKQQLEAMGIVAELAASNAPPPPRPPAETKAALVVGAAFGAVLAIVGRWVYHRVKGKG